MSLQEKRDKLVKKRERFQSAMFMGSILLMFAGGVTIEKEFNVMINFIICIASFGCGYLIGYYSQFIKWFNQ